MIRIGVIGYGYWGPNLVRNFLEIDGATVTTVCDRDAARLELARKRFPHLATTTDSGDLIRSAQVDAVVVAVPAAAHASLAEEALREGKHVLVEKPLASTSALARRITRLAVRRRRVLMVDHTFVYHPAVRKIEEIVETGRLGRVLYLDSNRSNLGLFQEDVDVVWDLAVHDLSIFDFIVKRSARAVSAMGARFPGHGRASLANIMLDYGDQLIGKVTVSWLSPVKIRLLTVAGDERMIVYDDNETVEKVRMYDRGVSLRRDEEQHLRVSYRVGDVFSPHLENREALHFMAREFVACIGSGRRPVADGRAGERVVRSLEAISASLARRGAWVRV